MSLCLSMGYTYFTMETDSVSLASGMRFYARPNTISPYDQTER